MTTKAPSSVRPTSEKSLEKIAYTAVENIPTVEPHDRDRLGYNVWRHLNEKRDSLEQSVRNAGARLLISEDDAIRKIQTRLRELGAEL